MIVPPTSREPTSQLQNATETNPRQEPGKEWGQCISLDTLFDLGMAEIWTSETHPEGWRRPGPCRAGLFSWRSPSTSALLPAVLEEDRASAPGRVHPRYPRAPECGREDHAACPGAPGLHGREAAVALPGRFPPGAVTWDAWTWAASVFESRTFALSAIPSWIQHGGNSPTSACESAERGVHSAVPRHA